MNCQKKAGKVFNGEYVKYETSDIEGEKRLPKGENKGLKGKVWMVEEQRKGRRGKDSKKKQHQTKGSNVVSPKAGKKMSYDEKAWEPSMEKRTRERTAESFAQKG